MQFKVEPTIFELQLKSKPRLKFFKFGLGIFKFDDYGKNDFIYKLPTIFKIYMFNHMNTEANENTYDIVQNYIKTFRMLFCT